MEHTISLASKAFIEAICPAPSQYRKGKRKTNTSKGIDSNGEDSDDDELEWLANLANHSPINADTEIDEDMDFDPEDLLRKVLALINQVFNSFSFWSHCMAHLSVQIRASPQAKAFFATMCQEEELKPLELIKWIRIRWGSMYDLINRVLVNRAVCILILLLITQLS